MKTPVTLTARIYAAQGKGDLLEKLLTEQVAAVLANEPNCVSYRLHRSLEKPDTFMIYEQYVDEEARTFHQNAEHLRLFRERRVAEGLVKGTPETEVFRVF